MPQVVIMHLNRNAAETRHKITTKIKLQHKTELIKGSGVIHTRKSISAHAGRSVQGGHFVCFCPTEENGQEWIKISDKNVTRENPDTSRENHSMVIYETETFPEFKSNMLETWFPEIKTDQWQDSILESEAKDMESRMNPTRRPVPLQEAWQFVEQIVTAAAETHHEERQSRRRGKKEMRLSKPRSETRTLNILQQNIGGNFNGKIDRLTSSTQDFDFIFAQEVGRRSLPKEDVGNGYKAIFAESPVERQGVAVIMKEKWRKYVYNLEVEKEGILSCSP